MKSILTLLLVNGSVLAAGGAGHGSPSDLIPSFVNIAILAAALLYILIPIMKDYFKTKSHDVSQIMERASVKAKEAEMLMVSQKKKISNLDSEIDGIKKDASSEVSTFKSNYEKEVQSRITNLKQEASIKIETEKQEMANNLNEQLIDAVIANAKTKIKADQGLNTEATNHILEGLR
jgi:F0F1-type ATP synthase membrane subunit b/b'